MGDKMHEDIDILNLEAYSLRDKNLLKLKIRLYEGRICQHWYDLLSEHAEHVVFNPEDGLYVPKRKEEKE